MIKRVTYPHSNFDFFYLVREENLALLKKIRPYVISITQEYQILSHLYLINNLDLALELSQELTLCGISPNPKPSNSWNAPLVFEFVKHLKDKQLPLLKYWLSRGLDVHATNNKGKNLLELENISSLKIELLKKYITLPKVEDTSILKGNKIHITDGPFTGFSGIVKEIDGIKYKVEVFIFGRMTIFDIERRQFKKGK